MTKFRILIVGAMMVPALCSAVLAASGGVQWSPDKQHLLAQKDVAGQRWAITLNLVDLSITGNVFFPDGRPPSFIWCDKRAHNRDVANLILSYRCFGSDQAQAVFDVTDWQLIGDNIPINASFFAPTAETCDLSGALNGADAQHATSLWNCTGIAVPNIIDFQLVIFGDGTGATNVSGPFQFAVSNGCGFGQLTDGSFVAASYSPSRDVLNFLATNSDVTRFNLSECHRGSL